jgi:hypothetical protein
MGMRKVENVLNGSRILMAVRRKDYPVEWNGKGTGWLDCIEELSWHNWL